MNPLAITIRNEPGFLFEGGCPGTYAFVPMECVTMEGDGSFSIDKIRYFKKRWAGRNRRFNHLDASGSRLFPDEGKPVCNTDASGLAAFLDHLRRGYGAGLLLGAA